MKQQPCLKPNHNRVFLWMRPFRRAKFAKSSNQGFTLIELLVAGLLGAVVILVAWSGLISAMSMSQEAQSRSARQAELNKALDFMTNEIRMARSINQSATLTANGTTVSLNDVVTSAGVNLASLGSYGTLGLYLERPITEAPAICPVGGPNAGSAPPVPADFDPIVYDIRPSPSGWLQPRMVARYGRVPLSDGTINPCSSPISSDPMVDALSITMKTTPVCSGVLSGDGGFYSCVQGKEAKLFFQSDVSKAEVRTVSSTVASRVVDVQAIPLSSTNCALESTLRSTTPLKYPSVLSINNKTNTFVNLYWLDTSGVRQLRGIIFPNQTWPQITYNKYIWVVTDSSGTCLDIFATKKEDSEVTIQ